MFPHAWELWQRGTNAKNHFILQTYPKMSDASEEFDPVDIACLEKTEGNDHEARRNTVELRLDPILVCISYFHTIEI